MFLIPVWAVHGLFRIRSATSLVFQVVGRDESCGESGCLGFGRVLVWGLVGLDRGVWGCFGGCFVLGLDGFGCFELSLVTGWVVLGWLFWVGLF
jgi:hypothetical protein